MKRNVIEMITKDKNIIGSHWNSMWYILYVYEHWDFINIKRVLDQDETIDINLILPR